LDPLPQLVGQQPVGEGGHEAGSWHTSSPNPCFDRGSGMSSQILALGLLCQFVFLDDGLGDAPSVPYLVAVLLCPLPDGILVFPAVLRATAAPRPSRYCRCLGVRHVGRVRLVEEGLERLLQLLPVLRAKVNLPIHAIVGELDRLSRTGTVQIISHYNRTGHRCLRFRRISESLAIAMPPRLADGRSSCRVAVHSAQSGPRPLSKLAPAAVGSVISLGLGNSLNRPSCPAPCQRSLLLVLDNCEHLLEASAEFVEQLPSGCPTYGRAVQRSSP
jgi:hypothetical protein